MTKLVPRLIHEEDDFIVLVKPAGLLMHALPGKKDSEPMLADWIAKKYPETKRVGDDPEVRPGIVHRLDKDTSGIVLVCRTQEFFETAKRLFQDRAITKRYLALTRGHLERERNIITRPLGIKPGTTQRSVRSEKMVKDAVTEYHVLVRAVRSDDAPSDARFKSTLLEVLPHTGRTHQIRVHLTSIGHPILGDPLYGPKQKLEWIPRLMLHALSIEFTTREGKKKHFTAPPDDAFLQGLSDAGIAKPGGLF
jgi:23S rRNA pseudouridine1911/1915/1917 synthase